MTRLEALTFLAKYARRRHTIVYRTIGPSHGDPGGQSFPVRETTCKYWDLSEWNPKPGKEEDCNCGAAAHNRKVDEVLKLLS